MRNTKKNFQSKKNKDLELETSTADLQGSLQARKMQPASNFFKKEYNYKAKRLSPNVVKAKHI